MARTIKIEKVLEESKTPFAIMKVRTCDAIGRIDARAGQWEWVAFKFKHVTLNGDIKLSASRCKWCDVHAINYPEEYYIELTAAQAKAEIARRGLVCKLSNKDGELYDTPDGEFLASWHKRPWRGLVPDPKTI